jgi:hypothetical protein
MIVGGKLAFNPSKGSGNGVFWRCRVRHGLCGGDGKKRDEQNERPEPCSFGRLRRQAG